MCIISIKKKGIKFPSVKIVKTMCENNDDGFSIVTQRHGRPRIYKTLKMRDFLNYYRALVKASDGTDTSMFIHARIKTHGTQRIENCHGWRSDGVVFAHNGILSIANRDDMTDSETFFRDIFIPAYRQGGWKMGEKTIDAIIGTSKFVFMDKDGEIRHYGTYIEDDGVLYSNYTYTETRYVYQPTKRGYSNPTNAYYPKTQSSVWDWQHDFLDDDKHPF
jgi:predicted glutamine amidotransferase